MRPIGIAAAALLRPAAPCESLDGFWMDSHGEVILDIGRCGNARCGKVAWLQKPRGPDRGPLRDFRNSDPKLQPRFVCGLPVVTGFKKQADGTWGDGTVSFPTTAGFGYAEVLGRIIKERRAPFAAIFGSSGVDARQRKPPSARTAKMIAETAGPSACRAGSRSGAAQKPAAASGRRRPNLPPMAARNYRAARHGCGARCCWPASPGARSSVRRANSAKRRRRRARCEDVQRVLPE
jgi:hypothetical protein